MTARSEVRRPNCCATERGERKKRKGGGTYENCSLSHIHVSPSCVDGVLGLWKWATKPLGLIHQKQGTMVKTVVTRVLRSWKDLTNRRMARRHCGSLLEERLVSRKYSVVSLVLYSELKKVKAREVLHGKPSHRTSELQVSTHLLAPLSLYPASDPLM